MGLTEMSHDYSNRVLGSQKDLVEQMDREETQQKENILFSSQEFAQKLQKENMTLMKALAHRNKIIELSGIEFQKLRINLRSVQEKNLQLAQANSQMLAELNTNRDRLKEVQHELGCKNALLNVKKQLEEQTLPLTDRVSKDKVHEMNQKTTKRKRTSMMKSSVSANVKPIHVNEKDNSKRRVSGVIDTTGIPEETCQTEDDIEKKVVTGGENQIIDKVVNKKFVLDAANPGKDGVHCKRPCTRRQSTRFEVQEIEQTKKLFEMDDAKETNETTRLSLKRRSARLKPEEVEPCKSFNEGDEVRETTKRRRLSSKRQSARFDFKIPEVTETLNADDAGSLVIEESLGSRSEAVEPSECRHDTKETNRKRRVSTRRQSTVGRSQTDEAIKETATVPSLGNNIVQECHKNADDAGSLAIKESIGSRSEAVESSVSRHDTKESNRKRRASTRRTSTVGKSQTDEAIKETATDPSLGSNIVQECHETLNADDAGSSLIEEALASRSEAVEPSESRHDTKETNRKRRVSTRRQSTMGRSQTDEAIKETATYPSLGNNIVQECHETESKDKPKVNENEGMIRRSSVGRPSRHAAEKVQSYREVSLKVKMRRKC